MRRRWDLDMWLMRGLSRRVDFRANGEGPGNHRTQRNPGPQSVSPLCKCSKLAPTAYIATAPNTAPATAPPSFGSSSEPSIIWLFDYKARVSFCFPLISSCIRPGEKFASDVP
jgi:hypothetical protein